MQANSWSSQQTPRSSQKQYGNVHMSVSAETNQQALPDAIKVQAVENRRAVRRWKVCVSHVSGYRTHFILDFTALSTYMTIYTTLFLFYWVSVSRLVSESVNWCQSSTDVIVCQLVLMSLNSCQSLSNGVSVCHLVSVSVNQCQSLSTGVSLSQLVSVSVNWCQSLSTGVSVCQLVSVSVNWCQSLSTGVSVC